jgi:hypothetical protein
MFKLEKRLTSFFRKNSQRSADFKKWTLHKSYETLEDATRAYNVVVERRKGLNWRILSGDVVIQQKNS